MNAKNILNAAALLTGMTGIFFKMQWWAGADILILTGLGLLFVSTVAFTVGDNKVAGTPAVLNYLLVATVAVGILAMVFGAEHWKGGFALSATTGVLLLVLSIGLIASKAATVSRQGLTVVAIWFTLITAWLNTGYARRASPSEPVAMEEQAPAQ